MFASLRRTLPTGLARAALVPALVLALAACGDDDPVAAPMQDIVELAQATPELSTLTAAVQAADLATTLRSDGPFTVFAPLDQAFAALGTDKLEVLLDPANQALLQKVLTYHVVPGAIRAADLTDGATVQTVQGGTLTIDLDGGASVNGAAIVATDIEASNGVVHLVDGVLTENLDIVDQATLNGFPTLVGAVEAAGLTETLRTDNDGEGFTVFAPTEAAFAALAEIPSDPDALADVLLYHTVGATVGSGDLADGQVVPTLEGGTLTVRFDDPVTLEGETNSAALVVTDVPAANGVIHVIDRVLLPAS